MTGGEHLGRVNRVFRAEPFDEHPDEGDVIDVLARRRAAARTTVPGSQRRATGSDADTVGIDDDEPVRLGEAVEARVPFELRTGSGPAVQCRQERNRCTR